MLRRPPRSTRTDTLFPSTTLLRSYPDIGIYTHFTMAGKRSGYMTISRMARLGPFNINISAGYLHLRMTHVLSPQLLGPGWREFPPARACPTLRGLAPIVAADP